MQHGCNRRCPKVREQLRKAREEASKEPDDNISSSDSIWSAIAGPSTSQKDKNEFTNRSKQSTKYPPGSASPTRIVGTPQKSQHTLTRGSPDASRSFDPERRSHRSKESQRTKGYPSGRASPGETAGPSREFHPDQTSHRRSEESQRSKGYPSERGSPGKSADPSRKFDPEGKSNRRNHESERPQRERKPEGKKKTGTIPKSTRNGRKDPDEYTSGSYIESDERKIPDYVGDLRRAGAGKSRGKTREPCNDQKAGPSRRMPSRREEGDSDLYLDCEPHCLGREERVRKLRNAKQQEESDRYLLYKNLPYFEDLCYCSFQCLIKQLCNDPFVKSTAASVAMFALGLKLCWELDGWTLPNTF